MSYLNSAQIHNAISKKRISIFPYFKEFQGPNLYYCHLGNNFLVPKKSKRPVDPLKNTEGCYRFIKNHKEKVIFKPGEFILAETFESFSTGDEHIIRLFNSSSLARLGVSHCAIGMVNPGCGKDKPIKLTLELVNNSPFPIILQPTIVSGDRIKILGTEILKIGVQKISKKVDKPYSDWDGALYGEDETVRTSQMHRRHSSIGELRIPHDSLF